MNIYILDERTSHDDGLYHRVLFCSPHPPTFLAEDIGQAPQNLTKLHAIMYHIANVHTTPREYFLSSAAISRVNIIFNKYQSFVRQANHVDFFLG